MLGFSLHFKVPAYIILDRTNFFIIQYPFSQLWSASHAAQKFVWHSWHVLNNFIFHSKYQNLFFIYFFVCVHILPALNFVIGFVGTLRQLFPQYCYLCVYFSFAELPLFTKHSLFSVSKEKEKKNPDLYFLLHSLFYKLWSMYFFCMEWSDNRQYALMVFISF